MTDYTPRKWKIAALSQPELAAMPLQPSPIAEDMICGVDSPKANELEKRGVTPFYYDYEQLEAGLDAVYGLSKLAVLTEDFIFSDFTTGRAGALVMILTKFDMETFIFTVLVEDI